jgi:hypothetical protein
MNQKHIGIDQCCKELNGVYKDEMEGVEMDRFQSFIKYNQNLTKGKGLFNHHEIISLCSHELGMENVCSYKIYRWSCKKIL